MARQQGTEGMMGHIVPDITVIEYYDDHGKVTREHHLGMIVLCIGIYGGIVSANHRVQHGGMQ